MKVAKVGTMEIVNMRMERKGGARARDRKREREGISRRERKPMRVNMV